MGGFTLEIPSMGVHVLSLGPSSYHYLCFAGEDAIIDARSADTHQAETVDDWSLHFESQLCGPVDGMNFVFSSRTAVDQFQC